MSTSTTATADPAALFRALKRLTSAKIAERKAAGAVERATSTHKTALDESAAALTALQDSGVTADELRSLGLTVPAGFAERRVAGAASATSTPTRPEKE